MASGSNVQEFSRLALNLDWNFTPEEMNYPPSVVHPNSPLSLYEERELRKTSALLILCARKRLPIHLKEVFKSIILMHRFYMIRPFQEYDMRKVTSACLIESCKGNSRIQPHDITTVIDDCLSKSDNQKFLRDDKTKPNYESLITETLGYGVRVDIPYESFFQKHRNAMPLFKSCMIMCIFCALHTTWYLTTDHTSLFLIHVHFLKKNGNWNLPKSFTDNEPWIPILNKQDYLASLDMLIQELLNIFDTQSPKLAFFLRNASKDIDIAESLSELSLSE